MSVLRQDENRITGFVESSSSVNGKENTAAESIDVLKIKDRERLVADNELGHKADLREGLLRRETTGNAEADSAVIERPLHGQGASTSGFRVENRRKSDGHSLLKAMLTPQFTNTRRKSASELEGKPDDRSTKDSRSTPGSTLTHATSSSVAWWNEQNQGNMRNDKSATSYRTNEDSIYTNDSVEETLTIPAMHGVNVGTCEEHRLSSPSWTHRKETHWPEWNRMNYGESVTVNSRRLVQFDRDFSSHKISFPDPGQGNLSWKKGSDQELITRGRSFSDSEVEDSLQMTAEQREKLEHIKCQILEKNLKRKDGRKVSEVKQNTGFRESRFPILTEKSLKRHSKCRESANIAGPLSVFNADQKISLIDVRTKVNPATSEFVIQNQDSDIDAADKTARSKCDPSSNTEQPKSEFIIAPPSSTLAYFENTQEAMKRKSNGSDIPTPPPNSEEGDFESISIISERLRARSEPGDVGTRKVSTVQQLQNRARSETVELKTKVQSFVKKPLPTLPPCSLRVTKQAVDGVTSKGHFKAGAHANITFERPIERREGIINIHTCPNMNLYSDKSWMYQDESRKRHRYIRGPATPVPPVEFVFRKDESDSP